MRIERRLAELGLTLPPVGPPRGHFVPCVQSGSLLFVSGQITSWGAELRHVGKVGREISAEEARAAARLCALNVIAEARAFLGDDLDRVRRVCQVHGFVNAVPEFTEHPSVINGASELLVDVFGEAGRHARFAIGAGSLPLGVAVEVAAILEIS
ncbi:MAG: RidA family protein [Myxococcales bacterium]|nr:RidA family protein [Myxococcales bacterium]